MDTSQNQQTPFYQRLSLILLSLGILCVGFYFGKEIILPILFAILLSTLLLPFTNYLARKGFHKVLSIAIPVLLTLIIFGGVLFLLSLQVIHFLDDTAVLKEKVGEVSDSFQKWVRQNLNITVRKQNEYLKNTVEDFKDNNSTKIIGLTFGSLTGILTYMVLLPLYTFLILYSRTTIKHFLIGVFKNGSETRVREILTESSSIAQHYITGLLIETSLVFGLNMVGFLVLGIKYPIFLALLAALLNLIPYVGIFVANIFCMFVTLVSGDNLTDVLWVGIILGVVQFIDNNFGMPLIVGNKVRINALVTIIGVLIGGALCGVLGMFLAIPALAVIKVICDKVPDLNPWGLLLGDESPEETTATKKARALLKARVKSNEVTSKP